MFIFSNSCVSVRRHKNEFDTETGTRRNEVLFVPAPDYTYESGRGYSAGEDDYGKILNSICNNAVIITVSELNVLCKYFGALSVGLTCEHNIDVSLIIVYRTLKAYNGSMCSLLGSSLKQFRNVLLG